MSKKPETLFKERVIPRLKRLPRAWVCKIQQVAKNGTPDIIMCLGGMFVAIELKSESGEVEPLQVYNLDYIATCGGIAIVLTPNNFDETFSFLESMASEIGRMTGPTETIQ